MPATIVEADVTNFAAELAGSLNNAAWTDILAYVNEFDITQTPPLAGCYVPAQTPESTQTDRMSKIFLAAHIATMAKRGGTGAAGPVTSEAVGGVRRSYGLIPMAMGVSSLASTRYGQLYLEIVGMSTAGPMLV